MRFAATALLFSFAIGVTGCESLTRPNEITIIAEPPPAPAAPPAAAAPAAGAEKEGPRAAPRKPAAKQGASCGG
jgi:hypothetical protein